MTPSRAKIIVALSVAAIVAKAQVCADDVGSLMRQVIGCASVHYAWLQSYDATTYVKTTMHFDHLTYVGSKIVGADAFRTGRNYTAESVNRLIYSAYGNFNHAELASQNSFPSSFGELNNRYLDLDFRNNRLPLPVVTPLSPKAFKYYDFACEETYTSFDERIIRIRVTPKFRSERLFTGTICVVERTKELAGVELKLTTSLGEVAVNQAFAPTESGHWLPVAQNVKAKVPNVLVGGEMEQVSTIGYEDVLWADEYGADTEQVRSRYGQHTWSADDNKKQIIWDDYRPMSLSDSELEGFACARMAARHEVEVGEKGENRALNFVLGKPIKLSDFVSLRFTGINGRTFAYAPTTGFTLEQGVDLLLTPEKMTFSLGGTFAYAFGAQDFMKDVHLQIDTRKTSFRAAIGQFYYDWKGAAGDPVFASSFGSLFFKSHWRKLVDRRYVDLRYALSINDLLSFEVEAHFNELRQVSNVTNASVFKQNHQFAINVPYGRRITDVSLRREKQASISLALKARPTEAWPELKLTAESDLGNIFCRAKDYLHFDLQVTQYHDFRLCDGFDWTAGVGAFARSDEASLINWKHFLGSRKFFAPVRRDVGYKGFVAFGPFQLSTNDWYAYGLVRYQSQALILKHLPFLRRWFFTEEIYAHAALIGHDTLYSELGYGWANVLKMLRSTFFISFVGAEFNAINCRATITFPNLPRLKKLTI